MNDIIVDLRETKGSKSKIELLSKHKDNDLLKLILQMTYDKVNYKYNMTLKQVLAAPSTKLDDIDLVKAIAWMTNSLGNTCKGKNALTAMHSIIDSVDDKDADILKCIINRDLRIGLNIKSLNKAIPGLIHEVEYMRCDVFNKNHSVKYPAYLQIKMDGTWREIYVDENGVTLWTRQGYEYFNPVLKEIFKDAPKGRYVGELTIPDLDRVQGNGNINSDNPSYDKIHFTAWDYITDPNKPYCKRLENLKKSLPKSDLVNVVETKVVHSDKEALEQTKKWMQEGEEGSVLKDFKAPFKNGTSKLQLKIKHVIELDVRVTGFTEGKLGTAREGKVGAIEFSTDDGSIQGQTSGFNEGLLNEITNNKEKYLGKIMTVQCNDLQLASGSTVYKLMHPRFIEFREDKNQTDDLDRAKQLLNLACVC